MLVIHSYIVKKYPIVTQTYLSPPPRSLVVDGSAVPTTVDSSAARSPETASASMMSQNRSPVVWWRQAHLRYQFWLRTHSTLSET